MILRVTRSVLARYGRPAMIFWAKAGPIPGSVSRSSGLAVLISISAPLRAGAAVAVVDAGFPVELLWPDTSAAAVKRSKIQCLKFITPDFISSLTSHLDTLSEK